MLFFLGRVRGVERDWGCAGKSIFIGNNSHICFAARLCATEWNPTRIHTVRVVAVRHLQYCEVTVQEGAEATWSPC